MNKNNGFTMIEVLIAIGILTVGALGVLSMQQTVLRANRNSRDLNHGLAALQTWVGRIERDALNWTSRGIDIATLGDTLYIEELVNNATVTGTDWFEPTPDGGSCDSDESYGFDFHGNDTCDNDEIRYCTNVRLIWLAQGSSARVDVRVYWMHEGRSGSVLSNWVTGSAFTNSGCDAADSDTWLADGSEAPNVDAVYGSTVVRWTGAP